ncbi:EpsG family protein [Caprobacter fermentans]|uniref:EpsG family protein n=1 Tax=Caproicibacter fermentans TaxID=2576756 RepID=A0A6N8HYM6_9FIRM|nr:EpsG family protein [Caproicibacter fermentans]MVB10862.1 EpsG family protein [Caproicibacter fermentans]QNK39511.1 EpsG family protein [Caproicibacter fermentans]
MTVYNLLLLLILVLGLLLCEYKKSKRNTIVFLVLSSLAMTAVAFLRADTVGIDYKQYETYFYQVHDGGWKFLISSANGYRIEPGYSLLNYVVSLFTRDVHIFMLVVAVVVVTLTAVLLYRVSPIPWIGMFVFVSFGFYGNSLSFLRQCIAISIFLFSIEFIKKRQFVPYLLIVLLAVTFHKSIIVMIPFYFIARLPVNWKFLLSYSGIAALITGLSWPIFNLITKYVYKVYATQQGLYYMMGRDWQTAAIPVITAAVILILTRFILRRDERNSVLINLSFFSALLYLMTLQHFLYQRFGMMFLTTVILTIPELFASIGVQSVEAEAVPQTVNRKAIRNRAERKRAIAERRQFKMQVNTRKYIYSYALATLVFVGYLYHVWILLANRINLVPYLTFWE